MAFVRRKGNTYFLVHNVRRQGKVQQLHLARLGERPRITDDVVRKVSRNHPFLELDWSRLREQVNSRVELFDIRSPYVQNLMHSLTQPEPGPGRSVAADVGAGRPANSSRELVTQLRLLRSTLDIKLDQFERSHRAILKAADLPIDSLDEMLAKVDAVSVDELTALAGELYGAERLSAACVGRAEDHFRAALAPVSESLAAA